MAEPGQGEIGYTGASRADDREAEIAALRSSGAGRIDPLRFHFIEALARRLRTHEGEVRRILEGRLGEALAACSRRVRRTRDEAGQTIERAVRRHPDAADELQRLFVAADFAGVARCVAGLEGDERRSPLVELARCGARPSVQEDAAGLNAADGAPGELRSLRLFRKTWAQRSAERQAAQAIARAPANAGPLNSHMLVLSALSSMRDLSPGYLNRFVSYADTLLRLDEGSRKGRRGAGTTPLTTGAKRK